MDKFDQTIKNVKQTVEPSTDFVERTMTKITNRPAKPRLGLRLWAPVLGSLVVIAVLVITFSSGSSTFSSKTPTSKTSKASKTGSSQAATTTPPATGTDNAALVSYLSGIQSSMNQENSDQNSANSSINDSSQEITVPTD